MISSCFRARLVLLTTLSNFFVFVCFKYLPVINKSNFSELYIIRWVTFFETCCLDKKFTCSALWESIWAVSGVFEDNGVAPKCCFESFPKLSLKSFHKSDCCGLEVQLFLCIRWWLIMLNRAVGQWPIVIRLLKCSYEDLVMWLSCPIGINWYTTKNFSSPGYPVDWENDLGYYFIDPLG